MIAFNRVCNLVLGAVFVSSGAWKACSPVTDLIHLRESFLAPLSTWLIPLMAGFEVYVGIGLLVTRVCLKDSLLAIGLIVLFCVYLVIIGAQRGWGQSCGCGPFEMSIAWAFMRNGTMLALCVPGLWRPRR